MKSSKQQIHDDGQRLSWLLAFLQRDLTSLRAGARLDLLDDCVQLLGLRDASINLASVDPPDGYAHALAKLKGAPDLAWPDSLVIDVQAKVNAGVARLEAGQPWEPFDEPLRVMLDVEADKTIRRRYRGSYGAIMVASAVDLLVAAWPRLWRCELTSCHTLFVKKDGRQQFCTTKHANLARYHRPPETRKPRDYAREEANASYREQLRKKKTKSSVKKGRSS